MFCTPQAGFSLPSTVVWFSTFSPNCVCARYHRWINPEARINHIKLYVALKQDDRPIHITCIIRILSNSSADVNDRMQLINFRPIMTVLMLD